MHPSGHHSIVYNSLDMETTEVSMKRWRDEDML